MSDRKQARVLVTAAERDISALHGMADAAVFADEIYRASDAREARNFDASAALPVVLPDHKPTAAEGFECAVSAGENDHLLIFSGSGQRIEHLLDARVVGKDQDIIENDWRFLTTFTKHCAHGEPDEHGDLLFCPVRELFEFFRVRAQFS